MSLEEVPSSYSRAGSEEGRNERFRKEIVVNRTALSHKNATVQIPYRESDGTVTETQIEALREVTEAAVQNASPSKGEHPDMIDGKLSLEAVVAITGRAQDAAAYNATTNTPLPDSLSYCSWGEGPSINGALHTTTQEKGLEYLHLSPGTRSQVGPDGKLIETILQEAVGDNKFVPIKGSYRGDIGRQSRVELGDDYGSRMGEIIAKALNHTALPLPDEIVRALYRGEAELELLHDGAKSNEIPPLNVQRGDTVIVVSDPTPNSLNSIKYVTAGGVKFGKVTGEVECPWGQKAAVAIELAPACSPDNHPVHGVKMRPPSTLFVYQRPVNFKNTVGKASGVRVLASDWINGVDTTNEIVANQTAMHRGQIILKVVPKE